MISYAFADSFGWVTSHQNSNSVEPSDAGCNGSAGQTKLTSFVWRFATSTFAPAFRTVSMGCHGRLVCWELVTALDSSIFLMLAE